ncbi:MAG TPA: tryptophan 2,3-dioxygenase family protein [Ktedonobacterales bacterium]|nr:tryptophan 2,3-dioxygenase family protein [Ktedonobacterales bacterium]
MGNPSENTKQRRLTGYELYLRTDELLSLQKPPEDMLNHDELQFQVVHQAFELWFKQIAFELQTVGTLMRSGDYLEAGRLLSRVVQIQKLFLPMMSILETMSPWDFLEIRAGFGSASGQESPGFRKLMRISPSLWKDFTQALEREDTTLEEVYVQRGRYVGLFGVAEGLLNYDEQFQIFRSQHYRLAQRQIGPGSIGTGGMPMPQLANTLNDQFYPELWEIRNVLTQRASGQR